MIKGAGYTGVKIQFIPEKKFQTIYRIGLASATQALRRWNGLIFFKSFSTFNDRCLKAGPT